MQILQSMNLNCFSSSVARITSAGITVGDPLNSRWLLPHNWELTSMFQRFVVQALFLILNVGTWFP
jgi:hypothetical protein